MSAPNPPANPTPAHSRENPEPHEEQNFPSLLLLFLCSVLIFGSALYFQRYSGTFSPLVYNEEVQGSGVAAGTATAVVDPVVMGKRLFVQNCVTCHEVTGLGKPGIYPPLAGSEWVNGNEEAIVRILIHGLGGPVVVNGATFNGAMPSFGPLGSNWKDEKIAYVLTYVRQEWGNKAPPVTAETVARIRASIVARGKAWTAEELAEYHSATK
jgi:mono/diheme cytochrome c family protein